MSRKFFSFLLLLFVSLSFAQEEVNKLDANGKKHGLWRGYHTESKRLKYEGTFDHGKETGVFKFFDDTKAGTVIATRDFSKGNGSAYTIFYNQKNNKVSEGNIVNRQYDGEWKYYHENSTVVMTSENYKAGKLEGRRSVYYPNGKIAEETDYKNGIRDGIYKKYSPEGVLLEDAVYKNGKFDGQAVYKNPDGTLVSKGVYKNGAKDGYWEFYEGGKLAKRVKYPIPTSTKLGDSRRKG